MSSGGQVRFQLLPLDTFHVRAVFVSTGRALVFDQVGQSKDWNCYRLQRILDAIDPRSIERQAGGAGKNIDAIWGQTKLNDDVVAREILLST